MLRRNIHTLAITREEYERFDLGRPLTDPPIQRRHELLVAPAAPGGEGSITGSRIGPAFDPFTKGHAAA